MISNVLTKQFFPGVACSIICAAAFFTCVPALAATTPLGPVYIENVIAIESAIGSHVQGNLEIKIKDGFPIPAGLSCIDSSYITTLKSGDPTLRMFTLLTLAQIKKLPVTLQLCDDLAVTAYTYRCSLIAVSLG